MAPERLLPIVYDELRSLAYTYMANETNASLQPTALVHEAYLRITRRGDVRWKSQAHFFAIAAREMRRVLIDHARRRMASKRGGGRSPIRLSQIEDLAESCDVDALELDDAISKLERLHARQGAVAELRCFGGLSNDEIADHLGVARSTAAEDWRFARSWLARELGP